MAWIWTLLSVFVFVYVIQQLLSPKNKKRLPPGPRGLPIFGHFHLLGKNPHQDLYHLARKHGPIMALRFGFVHTFVVSSPAAAELFLKTHDLVFASRPRYATAEQLCYGQRNMANSPYGPYWRDMRKLCTLELLSNQRVDKFEPMRKAEVGLLVSSLKQAAETRETVNLRDSVFAVTGDTTCLMLLGRKYSDLDKMGFKDMILETLDVAGKFNLADYFPYIGMLDLHGLNRRMKRLSKNFDGLLEKILDDHVQNKQEKKRTEDFVDTMVAIMESGKAGFEFDRRHVKAMILDLLISGMDTAAVVIEWTMSELMRHPLVMKKLQKELESVVGIERMVEESHLDKLEYLDCVVKESLRLHPTAPLLLPHEAMEDCVVDGFHIPKKSRVMVNVWAIGRDPNVWPNPETFSPERFMGSNIDLRGRDFQLIPFGSGRRGCPGIHLGLTTVRLLVAQLVHCFDWEIPNGMLPGDLDMSEHFGLLATRAKHLMAIPSYRLHI